MTSIPVIRPSSSTDGNSCPTTREVAKVKGFNVMLIEPCDSSRATLQQLLRDSGYDVYAYASFEKAYHELNGGQLPVAFELAVIDFDRSVSSSTKAFEELSDTERKLLGKLQCYETMMDPRRQFQRNELNYTGALGIFTRRASSSDDNNEEDEASASLPSSLLEWISVAIYKPVTWSDFMKQFEMALHLSLDHAKVIDLQSVFDLFEDTDLLIELVNDLLSQARTETDNIRTSITEGNFKDIGERAHTLKGSSAQLFAKPLSLAAFVLERAAKEMNMAPMHDALLMLEKRVSELEQFVNKMQLE